MFPFRVYTLVIGIAGCAVAAEPSTTIDQRVTVLPDGAPTQWRTVLCEWE